MRGKAWAFRGLMHFGTHAMEFMGPIFALDASCQGQSSLQLTPCCTICASPSTQDLQRAYNVHLNAQCVGFHQKISLKMRSQRDANSGLPLPCSSK